MTNNTEEMILQMVRDLENTSWTYHGYAYKRTMRNILVGKKNAIIAPCFTDKPYYGICRNMTMQQVEDMADELVDSGRLSYILTSHGRLYRSVRKYA